MIITSGNFRCQSCTDVDDGNDDIDDDEFDIETCVGKSFSLNIIFIKCPYIARMKFEDEQEEL